MVKKSACDDISCNSKNEKKLVVGGQAVIEGILMRSPNFSAVAVRKPNKKISVKLEKSKSFTSRCKICKWPLIRGIMVLADSVVMGTKALMYSSNESGETDEQLSTKELIITMGISLLVALLIFKFIPLLAANFLKGYLDLNNFWFNLADGLIKIGIFLLYLWALTFMSDVRRLFEYHGAEHKSIYCYEADKELTVKNIQPYQTMHPRCGTEFLLLVLVISIVLYMFIPFESTLLTKYLLRLLLLPLIAGISYEVLKVTGLNHNNWLSRIITYPGMMVQKLTTSQPADDQVEVAIASLEAVLTAEAKLKAKSEKKSSVNKKAKKVTKKKLTKA